MRSFKEQLQDFLKDKNYKEKFKDVELLDSNYLIEVFRYNSKSGNWGSSQGSKSDILIVDPLGGGVKSAETLFEDITHVARIIKVGAGFEKAKYKEGDCVLLNPFDTTGRSVNPDYAIYKQFEHSIGMNPLMPEDMREDVTSLQARYVEYQFLIPEDYNIGTQNVFTFLVPEHKIKAKYNVK